MSTSCLTRWLLPHQKKNSDIRYAIILFAAALIIVSCDSKEKVNPVSYTGPMREAEDVSMLYAEKDALKMRLTGKRVLEFENGDKEFPEGLYIEFYNEAGVLTSTLKANHAYFFKRDYQWRGRGAVEVKNLESDEQLNTEELYWKPDTKRIFTEAFVTIRDKGDVIYGRDLDAAQDLSEYTLEHPTGNFEAKEGEDI